MRGLRFARFKIVLDHSLEKVLVHGRETTESTVQPRMSAIEAVSAPV